MWQGWWTVFSRDCEVADNEFHLCLIETRQSALDHAVALGKDPCHEPVSPLYRRAVWGPFRRSGWEDRPLLAHPVPYQLWYVIVLSCPVLCRRQRMHLGQGRFPLNIALLHVSTPTCPRTCALCTNTPLKMYCQKCRTPLKLDSSLEELNPAAYDLLVGRSPPVCFTSSRSVIHCSIVETNFETECVLPAYEPPGSGQEVSLRSSFQECGTSSL